MGNHHNLCASTLNDRFRFKECVESFSPNSDNNTKNCNNIINNTNKSESVCKENTASCQNTDTGNTNTGNQSNTNNIANTELDLLSRFINQLPNNPERIPEIFREMYKLLETHIQEGDINLVNLVVHALIGLLNNTTYVTILAPYALQIITLLFAYFNQSHKKNDNEDKSETEKNRNLSKRHNVKI